MIKLPKKKMSKYLSDTPPKWFNIMTIVLVVIVFVIFGWTLLNIVGCGSPMVDFAKAKNPGCDVVKVTEKACGTEVILQCPFSRFETVCYSKRK
jgi:hypothetical protein